jgi:hypothetical protein
MGGGRSAEAKLWEKYRQGSRSGAYKVPTAKDYFITSAVRFNRDPGAFKTRYPKEYNLIDKIYDVYKKETGVDPRTIGVE